MADLPAPSGTVNVTMNAGTLSGFNVLDLGRIEPNARVELEDGTKATVVAVEGKRLRRWGATRSAVMVKLDDGTEKKVASSEIRAVLADPEQVDGPVSSPSPST